MNDHVTLSQFAAAVDTLQPVETWRAWKLGAGESYPLPITADSLAEAVCQSMNAIAWRAGDRLAIQRTHAGRNEQTLWLYGVKISTKRGRWCDSTSGGRKVWQGSPEPVLWLETAAAFAPVAAFDAFRDNAAGRDLQLVEQR